MKRLLLPLLALAVAGCARSPEQDLVESLCDNLVRTMDLPAVSNLVENLGADVNGRSDYRHCTPLYTAIQNGNEPAVRYLLERGADPNRTGNTWKTGPGVLGFAASTGKLAIVQALVEAGANVRGVDPNSGEYPLARAAWYFRPEVLEYLYSKGAVREPGSKSLLVPDWHPPLDADGDARYARTLRVLVAHGENIDELSLWGPPVAYAAANNATNAMAVAIELGADVNPRAGTGKRTPLHEAVEAGHAEAVGLLMAHGADPFASWDDAKTKYKAKDGSAIALALALGRTDIVRMIEEGLRARTSAAPSSAEETHAESAETAEPEPHAESADSPLATALAGGEWIPLVVESVYIDATAPRELRKNWIVSFSGGIKARVHSPVKTFGESYGDLPGKRFGVRFVDRAAALAALHGTVYSGELEVRSAQGPVSAAANAAAEKEAAVRAKLDAIVFDSLEYQDANAADVISDLCERARALDADEPDPAKKGVSVVVGVDVKDIDEILARTTVTLKERSVSLGAALDRVADAIGLKVRVVGGCVLLGIYKGPLECRIFPVPPDLASRFLGDGNDWKARFAEIGIEWPDGTYVQYLMSVGRLTVYNTPDDLDRIERALAEAARSPAEDDLTDAVRAKLDRIIVEKVEWQQKNIADAIADLGDFSRQFDPETDIRKRGVGFTLDLGEAPSEADLPRLTVRLHRVTLHSLLDLVADMADLEYRIEGGRVVLRRKDAKRAGCAASAREEDNDEKVQAFLRRIEEPGVIPELEWRDASVADVAQFLTDCSPILNPGTFEERGGVHFVTDADSEDFPKEAVPRVSCRAGEVSLLQAAHLAAEAAGWRATAYPESRAIRIGFSWSCGPVYSMADATPELVAAIERELPAAENPDESARLRSFLAARGVRWSESDEAQLRSDIGKLVFTVAEEDTARLIRAILAAPGFALRRIPVRAKVVSIEGDPTCFGLGGRDSALTIRTLSTEDLAEIAAAFDAGAEVTALEPLQAEEGLPAIWKQVSSPAPGFEALVVLTPAADGEGRRVHFVLRSFPPDADAETVASHGCAGDASLGPGEALLVGAIPVAGSPDRSLALLLEFPDTQSPEEEKTHAENAEPKPLSLAAKLQP